MRHIMTPLIFGLLAAFMPANGLEFLVLGDWGKGGNNGMTYNSIETTDNDHYKSNPIPKLIDAELDPSNSTSPSQHSLRGLKEAPNNGNSNNKAAQQLNQAAIARAMAVYTAQRQQQKLAQQSAEAPQFILAVGDNFYTKGVTSATDPYWDYLWTSVYHVYPSLQSLPWYPVLGNHDWGYGYQGAKAQLDRTELFPNGTWQMPSTNYSRRFPLDEAGQEYLLVIFCDTTTIAPSVNKCCNTNGGVSEQTMYERQQNQLQRIERILQEATNYLVAGNSNPPSWIVVVGHYPIFSAGDHGDVDELKTYLLPLLIKYKVNAYICGHDHISEHLQFESIDFFVVGAGSMTDSLKTTSAAKLVWGAGGYNTFATVTIDSTSLSISYYNINVTIVYSYSISLGTQKPTLQPTTTSEDSTGDGTGGGNLEQNTATPTFLPSELLEDKQTDDSPLLLKSRTIKVGVMAASLAFIALLGILVVRIRANKRKLLLSAGHHPDVQSHHHHHHRAHTKQGSRASTSVVSPTNRQVISFSKTKSPNLHQRNYAYSNSKVNTYAMLPSTTTTTATTSDETEEASLWRSVSTTDEDIEEERGFKKLLSYAHSKSNAPKPSNINFDVHSPV